MKKNISIVVLVALATTLLASFMMNAIHAQAQNRQALTPTPKVTNKVVKDESKATHVGANGVQEKLLTGDLEKRARDAAAKAVPGATINRVETDAEGSVYEAHMTKTDGSKVTVKFDNNFKVTSIEEGRT